MDAERWAQLDRLFRRIIELPRQERVAAADEACEGDAELLAELRSLLNAHETSDTFIDTPLRAAAADLLAAEKEDDGDMAGRRIGRYELIETIGRGGMGAVYLARRADGQFEQDVAIKLVKRGMDSDEIVRRFRAERQTLAGLNHPNIARLLDGGVAEDGRPYIVMEYVQGEPVDLHCRRRELDVEQRLALFLRICAAVEHAHGKLVIHRDLKPSNILVGADGAPKLLDFGIAKVLSTDEDEQGLTQAGSGRIPLTPEYASPEQFQGEPSTTQCDVYALGVILYKLLVGVHPRALAGRRDGLRHEPDADFEPERPSAAIMRTESGDVIEIAPAERARLRLRRRLRGDLDTIVLTAMHRDPERRYRSVEQLAEDIRRHLESQPIKARPDSLGYRAGKFIRRNGVPVGAAAAVLAALTIGLFVSVGQYRAAESARVSEAEQRRLADVRAAEAAQFSEFLVDMLASIDPDVARGRDVSVLVEVLDRAAGRIEGESELSGVVEAQIREVIGSSYQALGRHDGAIEQYRGASALLIDAGMEDSLELASVRNRMALTLYTVGRFEEADELYQRSIDVRRALLGEDDPTVVQSLNNIAGLMFSRGERHDAAEMLRRALVASESMSGRLDRTTITIRNNLGGMLYSIGDFDSAIPILHEVIHDVSEGLGDPHPLTTRALNSLGEIHRLRGELEEAESNHRRSLEMRTLLHGERHSDTTTAMHNLANTLLSLGRIDEGLEIARAAYDIRLDVLGERHTNTLTTLQVIANALTRSGEHAEAETLLARIVESRRETLGDAHPLYASGLRQHAGVLRSLDRLDEAESALREADGVYLAMGAERTHDRAEVLETLGRIRMQRDDPQTAEPLLRTVVEIRRETLGPESGPTTSAELRLAECLLQLEKPAQASTLLEELVRRLAESRGDEDEQTIEAKTMLDRVREMPGAQ